jgi:acetoacetyl-CoA synthetase
VAFSAPIWTPSPERIAQSNMHSFRRLATERYGQPLPDYSSLHRWSVDHPGQFWPLVWEFCGVKATRLWDDVVTGFDKMPGARWFLGSRLNFAENLLRDPTDDPALIWWTEQGRQTSLTRAELHEQVRALSALLRQWGIQPGDRIAGYLPNRPETVVAMLAAATVGAIWSSCSPDFGVQGVLDRFGQISPRILVTAGDYIYNGKRYDYSDRARQVREQIPSIERLLFVSEWQELLDTAPGEPLQFEQLPFEHPLYILYSSGTTGPPKCIVHSAGGTLLQHLKELVLHVDVKEGNRIFYFTTCGWMMWNWLASNLAARATVVLYDGSPLAPHPAILWDMAQAENITVFGTSPRYLSGAEKAGVEPVRTHQLAPLRTILSTGSPLAPSSFDYVYRSIKHDVWLASISGGTDLISSFVLGNPLSPVYRGEIQGPGLGMKVEIFDEQGRSLPPGRQGELVCTRPFPSMPLGFWGDEDGSKYREAYFSQYPNVWRHGDWAEFTPHGGVIIYGRSDATLNPGGVRIGTAEIYRIVDHMPEVLESLVVGQNWDNDVRVILFVKLRPGVELTPQLAGAIKQRIRENASPRHVPARIIAVPDIPRTVSGKISELAVKNLIHNRPVKNTEALANPECLKYFQNLPELTR